MANEAVQQFNIVVKSKDPTAISMQAGTCAHWFLQAGDEANYLRFKKISDDMQELAAKKAAQEIFGVRSR